MNENLTEEDLRYFRKVEDVYLKSGESVRETSVLMKISRTKVRKILITLGVMESEITEKAIGMINSGISQKKTAEKLGISPATLSTYLPYGNRVYNRNEKTPAAVRTEECRARQVCAASRQISSVIRPERKSEMNKTVVSHLKNTGAQSSGNSVVMKLHLELEFPWDEDLETIRKYGKAKEAISRDILVPGSMTLHALHYAIQKCFGWQNSHLHCFEYPQEVNDLILKNHFMNWVVLCGQYLRYPCSGRDALEDCYWDDDYSGRTSFKTWLKKKYTGPYYYGGNGEQYGDAQSLARIFVSENPFIELGPTFEEFSKGKKEIEKYDIRKVELNRMGLYFEHNMNELLERLKLTEVLTKDERTTEQFWDAVLERNKGFNDYYVQWYEAEDKKSWSAANTPDVMPLVDTVLYSYDYGDGWQVRIRCDEIYRIEECRNAGSGLSGVSYSVSFDGEGVLSAEETEQILEVHRKLAPVCTDADGLPVMDDVGGTGGYSRFLEQVYDLDLSAEDGGAEREELLDWAKGMGWTGRRTSPKNIL